MKTLNLFALLLTANWLNAQTFNKVLYNSANSGLPHNHIRSLAIDSNDVVWVGTQNGGLARFDGTTWTVWNTANSNLPANNIILAQPLANDEVWISTINVNNNNLPYTISRLKQGAITNLQYVTNGNDIVNAFDYFDDKVWISALRGLYVYENGNFSPYNTPNNCIPSTAVSDMLFTGQDEYWVALSDYSINGSQAHGILHVDQGNCTHYDMNNSGFPSDNVTLNLKQDRNNPEKVWMRTNAGIVGFDGTDWDVIAYPGTSLPSAYVMDTFGVFWISQIQSGFRKYDGAWQSYNQLVNDEINALAIDAHQNLWIGTQTTGLIKLERVVSATADHDFPATIQCYPSILTDELWLEQDQDRTLSFQMQDINGKTILQERFSGTKTRIPLTARSIPQGVYFYNIRNIRNELVKSGKLLKISH